MPFIDVRANCPITGEQETKLKTELGKAIALIPGKSESSLMVQLAGGAKMWFGGSEEGPIVMANVSIYGTAPESAFQAFGEEAVKLFREILGAKHVYVKFEETTNWAW